MHYPCQDYDSVQSYDNHLHLHSFPTRRSSDLVRLVEAQPHAVPPGTDGRGARPGDLSGEIDRKSTRLNSSHTVISYAVFCLKKKKKTLNITTPVCRKLSRIL